MSIPHLPLSRQTESRKNQLLGLDNSSHESGPDNCPAPWKQVRDLHSSQRQERLLL